MRWSVCLLLGVLFIAGCSDSNAPKPAESPAPQAAATTPQNDVAPIDHADDKQLAKFKQDYELAKSGYSQDPKSKTAKDTYVFTTVRYGLGMMVADKLSPHDKYSGALRLFREALKIDPTNEQAKQNKDLIEGIYKQMGRPVPQ